MQFLLENIFSLAINQPKTELFINKTQNFLAFGVKFNYFMHSKTVREFKKVQVSPE